MCSIVLSGLQIVVAEYNTTTYGFYRRGGVSGSDMDVFTTGIDEKEPYGSESNLRIPDVRLELAVSAMLLGLVHFAREVLELSDDSDASQRQIRWYSVWVSI